MKHAKFIFCAFAASLVVLFTGCGPSKDELAARENARIEQEKQAARDAEKANKAITDNNKKMFGRMNASTLGATPAQPTTQPAPEPKKP